MVHQDESAGRPGRRYLTPAIGATAALVWALQWVVFGLEPPMGDGTTYLQMASGAIPGPPQCFHILTPWLAGYFFPADPLTGFAVIAAFSFIGTAMLLDIIVVKAVSDATAGERVFAAGVFMSTCAGMFMFRAYFFTDPLSYFFLAAGCVAVFYRNNYLLALITAVAIFNRETALFVMPVWFFFNFRRTGWLKLFLLPFPILLPAATGYYLLHHSSLFFGRPPVNFNFFEPGNMLYLWQVTLSWLGTDNIYYGLAICVFLAYGPVWFIGAGGLWRQLKTQGINISSHGLSLWALAIPVLSTLMIVDWRRGFQPLFPAMIAAAVPGMRAITKGSGKASSFIFAAATVACAAACTTAWWYSPMKPQIIAGMAIWLAALVCLLIDKRFFVRHAPSTQ